MYDVEDIYGAYIKFPQIAGEIELHVDINLEDLLG